MTPNKDIFCNSPWYELHIYWDGSLGFCCQASHKLYPNSDASKYNLKNTTITQWHANQLMNQARLDMLGHQPNGICSRCYHEELHSGTSRRHRALQKSVIFVRSNFEESLLQSPNYKKFKNSFESNGATDVLPVDLHIDLGNHCNLACKMCNARASSTIAVQEVKWGIESSKQYVGTDWTQDSETWLRVINEIASIRSLKNIHFMGGETLLTKKFEEFVDHLISNNRTDLGISFVTNGTTFNPVLLDKLKKFNRVGIEVSIETITDHNSYVRQGTNTEMVLTNIDQYLTHCNNSNITVTIRPAISLLTIGYYHTLLKYCLDKKLLIKSLIVNTPNFMDINLLPSEVKSNYIKKYQALLNEYDLDMLDTSGDFNESDPNQVNLIIKLQIYQCISLLKETRQSNQLLWNDLVKHCQRWDQKYGYNALELYPELSSILKKHGY